MDINLLTPLINKYSAFFDTMDKISATEITTIAINECIVALETLKNTFKKEDNNISILNALSVCLSISEITTDIKTINTELNQYRH